MKKLLSVVLACAMIFTMVLPMSVFAEGEVTISSAETVTIELDEYAATDVVDYADDDSGNGKAVSASWGTEAISVEVPVVISESGMYDLVYVASNYNDTATPNDFSKITFDLNDGTTTKTIASTENDTVIDELDGKYAAFTRLDVDKFKQTAYLTEGTYTLTATITRAGGLYRGLMDYITFSAANETISLDSTTTIEMENYVVDKTANITTDTLASAGKYVDQNYTVDAGTVVSLDVPVTVAKTGFYDFEYVASNPALSDNADAYSKVTFSIGGTALSATAGEAVTLATTPSGAPAGKFSGRVFLTEGTYTLNSTMSKAYGVYRAMVDYIKFSASATDATIGSSEVTIKWADYKTATSTLVTETSGVKYLTQDWTDNVADETVAMLPITVAKSGLYDIEYVSSIDGSGYAGSYAQLDGVTIIDNTATVLEDVSADYPSWTRNEVKKYGKNKVLLDAGTYVLTAKVEKTSGFYRGLAAYIKFTPSVEEEPNVATTIAWAEGTNNVVVTSAIECSAKVIWVSYDANGKMVSWKTSEELTLTNVGTQTVNVPTGFETSVRKKAMLWTNTTNCKPLAAFID